MSQEDEDKLREKLEHHMTEKGIQHSKIPNLVCYDLKDKATGHRPRTLKGLSEGDPHRIFEYISENQLKTIIDFIKDEIESEELLADARKIIRLENQASKQYQAMEKEAQRLVREVQNGTPLKGHCNICPKITIQKNQNGLKTL